MDAEVSLNTLAALRALTTGPDRPAAGLQIRVVAVAQDAVDVVQVELEYLRMTTPSNLWGDGWGMPPHRMHARDHLLSRRQARRLSRRFAGVGVGIPAARLQEIAAGAPVSDNELTDVNFALTATEIKREERHAKFVRSQHRVVHWLIVAGLVLVVVNFLLCVAYLLFSLVQYGPPF
jgi:hypothetical protein